MCSELMSTMQYEHDDLVTVVRKDNNSTFITFKNVTFMIVIML